jgi:mRNA interferase MazF
VSVQRAEIGGRRRDQPAIKPSISETFCVGGVLAQYEVTTVPRAKLGDRIGRLSDEDVVRLNRALLLFLGLTR